MSKNKNKKNTSKDFTQAAGSTPVVNAGNYATKWTYKRDCHTGNSLVWKHPRGGSLFIGGWNQGATFDWNTHVIDLTGSEHKFWDIPLAFDESSKAFMPFLQQAYAGWLSLPFPDFGVPKGLNTREQWDGIAATIDNILASGKDVLVACHGGHGRSGLFCAIVGYLLGVTKDRSWASPVEKLRKLHCDGAVETFEQEKYVYTILGLQIQVKHTYIANDTWGNYTYDSCPICGTQSLFVKEQGMCLGCRDKYKLLAPVRDDLTAEDIQHKGIVEHSCKREKCVGIWQASKCGHVTHDMIVYDGYCQTCWTKAQEEVAWIDEHKDEIAEATDVATQKWSGRCPLCGGFTMYAKRFGVCYDCSQKLVESNGVDAVHNSITDPYKAIPHECDEVSCTGIVMADVCGHVVHDQEIEDGKCEACLIDEAKRGNGRGE